MNMRVRGRILALVLALSAPLALPARAEPVLHVGIGADLESLDPHRATSVQAGRVLVNLLEGLVVRDPTGALVPGAAERWETSADGLTWTFHLRADARWSDGTPVTAEDFVFSYRRMVDPATRPSFSNLFLPIRNAAAVIEGKAPPAELGVSAPDARTFRIVLERPSAELPAIVANSAAVPVHRPSVQAHGDGFVQPGRFVGNGAYVLAEYRPQSHLKLTANPHYHGKAAVGVPTLMLHVTPDAQTELKRFRAGELDVTDTVPVTQIAWARKNLPDRYYEQTSANTRYLTVNLGRQPLGSSVELRRALSLAIDREALGRIASPGSAPATSMVPPDLLGYRPPDSADAAMTQAQRDALAKELFAKAGYGPSKPLRLEVLYPTSDSGRQILVAIAAMWKQKLGVETTLTNTEFRVMLTRLREKDYPDLALTQWVSPQPTYALSVLKAGDPNNYSGYANPAFEAAVDAAAAAPDLATLNARLREAEAMALADYPTLPLFHPSIRRMVSPKLANWADNSIGETPLRFMRLKAGG